MSNYQTNNNSGSMFVNKGRTNENNWAHVQGKALIGGQWYYASAWTKSRTDPQTQQQEKWQSLSFKPIPQDKWTQQMIVDAQAAQVAMQGGQPPMQQQMPQQQYNQPPAQQMPQQQQFTPQQQMPQNQPPVQQPYQPNTPPVQGPPAQQQTPPPQQQAQGGGAFVPQDDDLPF